MAKTIKVLFAPSNTASMPDITLQALNRIEGIEAQGLSYGANQYWSFGDNWTIIPVTSWFKNPFKRIFQVVRFKIAIAQKILWADILMWHWDIDNFEFLLVKLFKKKIFVEWIGSDIRVPEILFEENPYYKQAWDNGDWDYKSENKKRSDTIQHKFYKLNASPLVCPEMSLFLNPAYFNNFISFYQRIDIRNYSPNYPNPSNQLPVVVHTPSATGTKGTRYVRNAIENLKQEGLKFEYVEIHNKTRDEALNAIHSADIFIDQFIGGSYGLATCEALAMGKPVLCYLMPFVVKRLPQTCPIINTSIDAIQDQLRKYLLDASLRNETGKQSRMYAESYHDADKIALQLEQLYKAS